MYVIILEDNRAIVFICHLISCHHTCSVAHSLLSTSYLLLFFVFFLLPKKSTYLRMTNLLPLSVRNS